MEKKTTYYNKLVRDNTLNILASKGCTGKARVLDSEQYLAAVDAKLDEELAEYHQDQNLEELADLLEVLYAAAKARGYTLEQLEQARTEKAEKRGTFEHRIFLESVTE